MQRIAGDMRALDDRTPNGKTVEYISNFINGEGTPEELLLKFVNDPVTDKTAGEPGAAVVVDCTSAVIAHTGGSQAAPGSRRGVQGCVPEWLDHASHCCH